MLDSLVTNKVTIILLESISNNQLSQVSAMNVIAKGMEIMETFPNLSSTDKRSLLLKVIHKVAAGADGILGTEDDLLPKECMETLKIILENNLADGIIGIIADTAHGKFNINKVIDVGKDLAPVCLPLFSKCFGKKKEIYIK
jgi:hypothetical protein